MELHRELNALKQAEYPWLYEVSKCAPQEALRNLDRAFESFFRQCKVKNKRPGYPRFKSRKRGIGGFRLTGTIKVDGKHVQLPRLGKLRLKEETAVSGKVLSATVSERAGRWFVSILVETEIVVPENQGAAVGVDLGVKVLATLSDGTVFENPTAYRRSKAALRRAQRTLSRRVKGSHRWERARQRVARLHYRIACIRADAIHKLTTHLATKYSTIGIENLNVAGMVKNHRLAGAVSDAGFGEIRRQLEYKSAWYGSTLVTYDRWYASSKLCSGCRHLKDDLPLGERVYRCESCGLIIDRDLNAAKNLDPERSQVLRFLDADDGALATSLSRGETPSVEASTERQILMVSAVKYE